MITVDWAWTYGFGAGFAACAARQLKKEEKPFNNQWYVFTLTFLSVFFVPACVYLVWEHPQWESAQLAKTFNHMLFGLRHDAHAQKNAKDDEKCNGKIDTRPTDQTTKIHDNTFPKTPRTLRWANVVILWLLRKARKC